jgi:hypothetical protein
MSDFMDIIQFEQVRIERAIRKDQFEDLHDDPHALRWRAWWDRSVIDEVIGIKLQPYPVVRVTPAGAWIDPHAYRCGGKWSPPYKELLRWVSNDGGAAWAKPSQQIAIDSLLYRYRRWGQRCARDLAYFIAAGETLKELFPAKVRVADEAFNCLRAHIERTA